MAGDLLAKHYVMPFLANQPGNYFVVIDKVLTFRYSLNDGAGFGAFSGKQTFLIVLTIVAMVVITGVLVFLHLKNKQKKAAGRFLISTLVMILAGGVGNLVDRIMLGEVRDFIDYTIVETIFNRSFAICNLADVWLTLGMIFLIIYVIFFFKEEKPVKPVEPDDEIGDDEENVKAALEMYENKGETSGDEK